MRNLSTTGRARIRPWLLRGVVVVSVTTTCCWIAVQWSELLGGLGLSVAILAWLAPASRKD